MRKACVAVFLVSILLFVPTLGIIDAYGSLFPPPVGVDHVTYDYSYSGVRTNGGFVKITGVLKSNVNREYRVLPYLSVSSAMSGPFGIYASNLELSLRY